MNDSVSSASFCQALAHFASGVTIVAAQGSAPVGLTATSFTSTSLSPPLVLVCIGKKGGAHDRVVSAQYFGVSVLGEEQAWVAEQFARSGIDRFRGVPLARPVTTDAPLIAGALVQLECQRHACFEAGDHTILVGRVLSVVVEAGRPLVRFARQFGAFVPDSVDRGVFAPSLVRAPSANEDAV
jgi:flavin reductase ActVB